MVSSDLIISPFVLCSSFKLNTTFQVEKRDLVTMTMKAQGNNGCTGLCYMRLKTAVSRFAFALWL